MFYKASALVVFLFFSVVALAQRKLTAAETQHFYSLLKQTKEYTTVKAATDAANETMDKADMPQEITMEMVKGETNGAPDDYIFHATLDRKLALGVLLDHYVFAYDKQKKQIVATTHQQGRFDIK